MTYIIAEPCIDIKDRSCVDVCPVDCIHEAGRILVIDPEECIDCGACEPECPVEAIFPEDALPEKWAPFVKINYAYGDGHGRGQPSDRRVRDRAQRPERAAGVGSEPTGGVGRIRFWIRMAEDPHELSALYALDALTGEDLARFEAHLAECDRCRQRAGGSPGSRGRARVRRRGARAASGSAGPHSRRGARRGAERRPAFPPPVGRGVDRRGRRGRRVRRRGRPGHLGGVASSFARARSIRVEHPRRPERAPRRRLRCSRSARRVARPVQPCSPCGFRRRRTARRTKRGSPTARCIAPVSSRAGRSRCNIASRPVRR